MTHFFSIIIPVYNVAPYLRECLDSVLAQTFTDWEAICVDDGSTDCSCAIIEEYALKDGRFRIIHQPNAGEGCARNAGIVVARGEWVFFLDGDDLMLDGALEKLAQVATTDADIVRFGFCAFEDGARPNSIRHDGSCPASVVDVSNEIKISEFYSYVWQHIFRRSVIDGIKFKSYKRGCDRVFLVDAMLNRVNSIKVIDFVCYGYRRRAGSAVNSLPSARVLRDEMDHRLDIMEMIDASGMMVDYARDIWLEGYFTRIMSGFVRTRCADRREVMADWRERLVRLRHLKGISAYGRFVAWTCPFFRLRIWDYIVCHAIPLLCEGGSTIRRVKGELPNLAK